MEQRINEKKESVIFHEPTPIVLEKFLNTRMLTITKGLNRLSARVDIMQDKVKPLVEEQQEFKKDAMAVKKKKQWICFGISLVVVAVIAQFFWHHISPENQVAEFARQAWEYIGVLLDDIGGKISSLVGEEG